MSGDPLTFASVFFQLAAGIVLLFQTKHPRVPARLLAAMLLLNAGVTAIWYQAFWPPWDDGRRIAAALDAPTEMLMFAFLASLSAHRWAKPAVGVCVGLAVLAALVAPWMYPNPATPLSYAFEQARSVLYFVGLAVVSFRLAGGGEAWWRWAALAFLPRAFYWSTVGGFAGITALGALGGNPRNVVVLIALPFLVAISAAAFVRLLRGPTPPGRLVAAFVPLTGLAIAIAEVTIRGLQPVDPILVPMLSLLTLGIHRPLFLIVGLAPGMLGAVVVRSLAAAGVGIVALEGMQSFFPDAPGAAVLIAFVSGAMALAIMEVLWPRLEGDAHAVLTAPAWRLPASAGASRTQVRDPSRPQWQEFLLALRGSSLPDGQSVRGEPHLMQRAIVARTGIRASRISSVAGEMNTQTEARLDAYVPGWRSSHPGVREPQLIQQYRGNVAGLAGVWVFYRLTPLGEALAEALGHEPGPEARGAPTPGAEGGSGAAEPEQS